MKTSIRFFHWLPRIFCILAVLFLSAFALDSFAPGMSFRQQLHNFVIHLIPVYVLIGFIVVAWIWEYTGGIILTIAAIGFSVFIFYLNFDRTHSVAAGLISMVMVGIPFVLAGILFILSYFRKKKNKAVGI